MNKHNIGIGLIDELSLRVSVGALVKVLLENPENGQTMLALERIATLREINGKPEVIVKAKPFGGGVQITNQQALTEHIGNFNYDSERSREEKDFRVMVHPNSWEKIKDICKEHFQDKEKGIIDTSPDRELAEEFKDSLKIKITPNIYNLKSKGIVIENLPTKTDNVRVHSIYTVRIYFLYEAEIISPEIIEMMLTNSKQYSDRDLQNFAFEDYKNAGKGRANAILALNLNELMNKYKSLSIERLNNPVSIEEYKLDSNVLAILNGIDHPKYQHI